MVMSCRVASRCGVGGQGKVEVVEALFGPPGKSCEHGLQWQQGSGRGSGRGRGSDTKGMVTMAMA